MALLYEAIEKTEDGERHQFARRDDGQWFSRWVWNKKFTPWIAVRNPVSHHGVSSETAAPDEIFADRFGLHRLQRYTHPDLPKDK